MKFSQVRDWETWKEIPQCLLVVALRRARDEY